MAFIRACGGGGAVPIVPDGRTVTPINNAVIWQKCAGIANPSYSTLDEILADVGILKTLMADENAVDYLVRCKDWAGKALVPTMTSNTTPSGECFGSGAYSAARDFFYAFDNNVSTYWAANVNGIGSYIAYDFTEETVIGKAIGYGEESFKFEIEYSEDKTTWLSTGAVISFDASLGKKEVSFSSQKARYWRAKFIDPSGGLGQISSLQFYSPNLCENANAMTYIGMFDYAADTLLADADWREAICSSTYFENVLNVKVPTMTSDTTPSGTIVHSRTYNNFYPWYVFSNPASSTSGLNVFYSDADYEKYIGYDFGKSVKVHRIDAKYCHQAGSGTQTNSYKLQTSINGNNYDDISNSERAVTTTNPAYNDIRWSDMQTIICNVNCNIVRSILTGGTGGPSWAYMQIYGRERGTVQTWLHKAGITDKAYTDISEVLNDPVTLATLMASVPAVDYLVTVKKWISDICGSNAAMQYIGANNYASNILLADDDWCSAICNSTYFESVLNVKVPTMTSDATPSGECSASSVQSSNYTAYKAFDNDFTGIGWLPRTADGWGNAWVAYTFTTDVKVKRIKLYFYNVYNNGYVTTIKIQGKNTETNLWDDISSNIAFNENTTKVQNINTANSNKKYQQFRLLLVSGSSGMNLGEGHGYNVQFYGRADV